MKSSFLVVENLVLKNQTRIFIWKIQCSVNSFWKPERTTSHLVAETKLNNTEHWTLYAHMATCLYSTVPQYNSCCLCLFMSCLLCTQSHATHNNCNSISYLNFTYLFLVFAPLTILYCISILNKMQNKGREPAGIFSKSWFFFNSFFYEAMVIWDTSKIWGEEKENK